jgi:hypothetical protein
MTSILYVDDYLNDGGGDTAICLVVDLAVLMNDNKQQNGCSYGMRHTPFQTQDKLLVDETFHNCHTSCAMQRC